MQQPVLVIMAAGMGSRYGGLKQIDPVGPSGQAILDYSIYDAHRAGFRRVVFIIRPELRGAFEQAVGQKASRLMQVDYAYQTLSRLPEGLCAPAGREKPLGTAHAVWCAHELVEGCPIAVINADDFYGADAFRRIYDYLAAARDDDKYRYCMVGYRVENTLTENGTVSRGVCTTDENGFLTRIVERTAISKQADGRIVYAADGGEDAGEIAEGTPVSLNLWGFTSSFVGELDAGLRRFFEEKLPGNLLKAEYYLPSAVDELLKTGKATAQVLKTDSRWFGVTYREDKPVVTEAVRRMTEQGEYPADL
ncbi:nucleotidyltransferase family protein [Agathobaculum sp.]|uniref:nucleotidyltransferase family protein n=1 Tax=Agathobaculum sp. TaxID=2048138 RepID=UPI002A808853|nr:sugar phosphate nucleotidyltransferase [Agathobaculum sp.]MDY3618211.1 sugar phosphate nucleotidyltransferase [Agathobaculum sp.]